MQATWSERDYEESYSTTSKDVRYDQNDFLAFVASIDSMHDSDCYSDSECEYNDGQNTAFLNNLVVEYENLIKKYFCRIMIFLMLTRLKQNFLMKNELITQRKFNFLSLNIIAFLRETMFSLKRLRKLNPLLL